MTIDLKAAFNEYFELLPADTDALREEVFRLRYQVYVVETGFERAEDFLDGLERDAYDSRSDHHLLRHRRTGLYAAAARMILPAPEAPDHPYPMEQHCSIYAGAGITEAQRRLHLGRSPASRYPRASSGVWTSRAPWQGLRIMWTSISRKTNDVSCRTFLWD